MRISSHRSLFAVILLGLLLIGCEGGTEPNSPSIPIGLYRHAEQSTQGGVETKRVRTILLPSQLEGHIYDTLYTLHNGSWEADSTAEIELHFQLVGDGYQRTTEVHRGEGMTADTTIGYWYFFRRGDSLYYYMGHRLLGTNAGIVGSWESDPRDTAATRRYYALNFTRDSVSITYKARQVGDLTGIYRYQTDRNKITIAGLPFSLGSRYEVVPGWSLYLTSEATVGYEVVK